MTFSLTALLASIFLFPFGPIPSLQHHTFLISVVISLNRSLSHAHSRFSFFLLSPSLLILFSFPFISLPWLSKKANIHATEVKLRNAEGERDTLWLSNTLSLSVPLYHSLICEDIFYSSERWRENNARDHFSTNEQICETPFQVWKTNAAKSQPSAEKYCTHLTFWLWINHHKEHLLLQPRWLIFSPADCLQLYAPCWQGKHEGEAVHRISKCHDRVALLIQPILAVILHVYWCLRNSALIQNKPTPFSLCVTSCPK